MRIYTKILLITLPLVLLSMLAGAGSTAYLSRSALNALAENWLKTKLAEAVRTVQVNEQTLQKFGLQDIPANVKAAQDDAGAIIRDNKVGEQGVMYVVDAQGIIVVHPDPLLLGSDVSGQEWFRTMRESPEGQVVYSWQDQDYLAQYAYFAPWKWYLIAADTQSEVYGAINNMQAYMVLLGLGVSALLALVLIVLTRQLLAPLRQLTSGAKQIGAGQLETSIPVRSHDEIGDLTRVFNTMASQLKEMLAAREQAEAERARLQDEIIRVQAATLKELSTPLIPITNQLMVMPLIGAVDTQRAQQILDTLLRETSARRARVVILDITGVPTVDTQVASALVQAAQAVRLLGVQMVLTGIRGPVAQRLVELGIDFNEIATCGSLQSGITYALQQINGSAQLNGDGSAWGRVFRT